MTNLETIFAGLRLKNPIIAASSGFTGNLERCRALCEAGVSAIVLKSIFEEQIEEHARSMQKMGDHSEAADMLVSYVRSNVLNDYIKHLKAVKQNVNVPVIGSICCSRLGEWKSFAKVIEEAGADALELNIMSLNTQKDYQYGEYEIDQAVIFSEVKRSVRIPVTVKLTSRLTNPVVAVNMLYSHGATDVVLFNRHYQTDIDTDNMRLVTGKQISSPHNLYERLRWAAICSASIPLIRYAVSGGVHSGNDIVKSILAGASAVEVCSALYKHGVDIVSTMLSELYTWMERKGFSSISSFKGKLNFTNTPDPTGYERTQFMEHVQK